MGAGTMSRWRAGAIHLGISALVATLVFAAIYFLWYPGALFEAGGGRQLFLLIACVDVAIGPLITLIIFRPGKRGLKFDLATIALLQLAALSYGTWVLYDSRPVWIAFVKDRFELARANQIMDAERVKAKAPFDRLSVTGPRLAGVRMPTDPDEQLRIAMTALAGQDVHTYPQYLVPYDDVRSQAAARAKPLARLVDYNPGAQPRIDALARNLGRDPQDIGFLPMRAGKRDLTVLVDRKSGEVLETSALKPWQY